MLIENVYIFTENNRFEYGSVLVEEQKIKEIISGTEPLNAEKRYLIPGMIDMHFHGCMGYDFCDGTIEALNEIAKYELSLGVTSICPATMTLPVEQLEQILKCAAYYKKAQDGLQEFEASRASLVGINMEGPFISKEKCGAQDPAFIEKPNMDLFHAFMDWSDGLVKVMGVAPETEGAADFVAQIKNDVCVSIAHSNASYEEAIDALSKGASHGVHLFNGTSAFNHRNPGIPGAIFDHNTATAELICDGVHVHPATVRMAAKLLGLYRLILVSDSMRAAGLEDGQYLLGGQEVNVEGNQATLVKDGSLAGSVTPLPECFRIAVCEMHIPIENAVAAVTKNPAKVLGIDRERGYIKEGYFADLVLLDENFQVKTVWKNGKEILENE